MEHEYYMKRALKIAKKGEGWTNPNPMVGAVIVKNKRIIAEGYHEKAGGLHAERNALKNCKESTDGAVMYVSLEPCCHQGKTPPCTEAIIESGIKKVVIATFDPNPLVAGEGIAQLRGHGIEVITGVLEKKSKELNTVFNYFIQNKTPYVLMKYAMTLDGKIATKTNESKWITNKKSRHHVHKMRHKYGGILVGINTVLEDDPLLTARIENSNNPTRIICDTDLKIPIASKIVKTAGEVRTIMATGDAVNKKADKLRDFGIEVIETATRGDRINLEELMTKLGERKIDSVLIEGGAALHWSALNEGLVNYVYAYIAPKFFGGRDAKTPIGGEGIRSPQDAYKININNITRFEEDIFIEGEIK